MSRLHDEHAQGVIEFAVILMTLMVLFLGTVDFSRFLYYQTAIQSAARAGAGTAGKQCVSIDASCGTPSSDYLLQATVCEAQPYVTLQTATAITSCNPCGPKSTACSTGPCGASGCQACPSQGQDVCVSQDTACTAGSTAHTCFKISVGFNFQPISFLLNTGHWLFSDRSCWGVLPDPGSDPIANGHTLCAAAEGRTS
jgi:hypothetical protein